MIIKIKRSDNKKKKYNPDKRPKRKTYDNPPNYQSESRKPGDSDVKLPRPLIPYDARIADEGPILRKKAKPKKLSDKKLYTKSKGNERDKWDEDKLMTIEQSSDKRKPFDNEKLMTIKKADKPKPYDGDKLMYYTKADPKKQDLTDDRLMRPVRKVDRPKLHDDRLLTVEERKLPTKSMKRMAEDIAAYKGTYQIKVKKGKDYHPSSRHLASKRYQKPVIAKTHQRLSVFWSKVWPWDLQPKYVMDKKPKIRRDKNEGQIWDNTVHPSTWNNKNEQAESGEEQ